MTARVTMHDERTEAAERYRTASASFTDNGAADAPSWLAERRRQGMERFVDVGFPHGKLEAWRFTDVRPIVQTPFALAPGGSTVSVDEVQPHVLDLGSQRLAVFVNGRYAPEVSTGEELPAGVWFGSLRAAIEQDPDLVNRHLGQYAGASGSPFAALATAFVDDGAFLYVPKDVVIEEPFQILFLAQPSDDPVVIYPRTLVVAEQGARATVLESYAALGEGVYWSNAVTEIVAGANATIDAYRLQREAPGAYHTGTSSSHQARDSRCSVITATFGGALSRHDIHAGLHGEGADLTLDGLGLMRHRQHTDWHTTLEHAAPNCTSWEYFNGVFAERARGVFTGRIIVRPGAQKTDSKQTNNNLLLSERARADSQPQLEIYADDVKCTHGATLGPIDQEHLFYLQARGLRPEQARAMLTYGFALEVLSNVAHEPLRKALDGLVQGWLVQAADVKD